MFERFTTGARAVVTGAQTEARALHHDHIGTEHVLLALLADPEGAVARATRIDAMVLAHNELGQRIWRAEGFREQADWRRWVRPVG